jgi:hypothetical protein
VGVVNPLSGLNGQGHRVGLWALAWPAAALVPVFVAVALAHRAQWPVGDAEPWQTWIVPWTFRVWALVMGTLLAGYAATIGPADPRRGRRALGALTRTGLATSICLAAALPGAVWLVRLGVASGGFVVSRLLTAVGLTALAGVAAAVSGVRLPPVAATAFGALLATGGVWIWAR